MGFTKDCHNNSDNKQPYLLQLCSLKDLFINYTVLWGEIFCQLFIFLYWIYISHLGKKKLPPVLIIVWSHSAGLLQIVNL